MLTQVCLVLLLLHRFATTSKNVDEDLSRRIFKSLVRVLDYIYENRQDMNMDALFGVVFVEAHLQSLKYDLNFFDTAILNYERNKISKLLNTTNFNQISSDFKHKIFFRYLLDSQLWQKNINFTYGNFVNDTETLTATLDVKTCNQFEEYVRDSYFSEELSDKCLIQLIKSSLVTPNNCHIDRFCSDYMVDNNFYMPAYGMTHRLLFLQVAEARRCNWNRKWLDKRIKEYCSYIYWEARKNSDCGFIASMDDLFLEQILLCGNEGFIEFMQRKWMEYVLSIQTAYGCFGVFDTPCDNGNELRKRCKRESNVIRFGCIDHTTGLGAGVLSLFLRFLTEDSGKL